MTLGSIAMLLPAINRGFAASVAEMQHQRGARTCDPIRGGSSGRGGMTVVVVAVGVRTTRVGTRLIGQAANFYGT